jgi:flagellar biosynthesis protein FlhF
MHLKRYRSSTVRDALAQARAELGPDALVLSTRLVSVRGVRGWLGTREVELTAAHDSPVSSSRPSGRSADTLPADELAAVLSRLTNFGTLSKPDAAAAEAAAAAIRAALVKAPNVGAALDAEDARDDEEFHNAAIEMRAPRQKDPGVEAIIGRLCATGLHRDLAERIARDVPKLQRRNGSIAALERAAAAHLTTLTTGDEGYAPVELFVGPPGAGKTTTIAKIAAQERARRGMRLNLLAADGFRVGAVEQLRLYADIIGTPFTVARTPADIEQSLLGTRGPVLVDTAGRSARDPRAHEIVSMLSGMSGVRTHLVVPAAASVRDVHRVLDIYGDKSPRRVVLTRVDEAESVSPLMQVFQERGLKVSYLGTGQRVPDDLERATPERLAAHVLGHGVPVQGGAGSAGSAA